MSIIERDRTRERERESNKVGEIVIEKASLRINQSINRRDNDSLLGRRRTLPAVCTRVPTITVMSSTVPTARSRRGRRQSARRTQRMHISWRSIPHRFVFTRSVAIHSTSVRFRLRSSSPKTRTTVTLTDRTFRRH